MLWKAFTTNTRFIRTEEMTGPYWFFSSLFYVSLFSLLLFIISDKFFKRQKYVETSLFIASYIIGFIILYTSEKDIYGSITRTLIISFIFYLGFLWRKYNFIINYNWLGLSLSIIILIIGLFTPYNFINIAILELENPIIFLLYSICGTYMLLSLSRYIAKYTPFLGSFLSYTGSKTLIILLTNNLCIRIFNLIRAFIENYQDYPTTITEQSNSDWYWWILYTIFMIILPLGIDKIVNKLGLSIIKFKQ